MYKGVARMKYTDIRQYYIDYFTKTKIYSEKNIFKLVVELDNYRCNYAGAEVDLINMIEKIENGDAVLTYVGLLKHISKKYQEALE
jgi:hypothetical protein